MKVNKLKAGAGTPKALNVKDSVIIPQKERNYIDTLYLSCNLQDQYTWSQMFGVDIDEHHRYLLQRSSFENLYLLGVGTLGYANGYQWYQLPNYRIGIMEYAKAKRSNQPNCIIQYEHDHLWELDKNLNGLDLPFTKDFTKYMIKRIDITKTAVLDTDYTINHGYINPFRTDPLNYTRHENTVYLGSRKNGNVFRMYHKTKELMDTKNYDKIAKYSAYFGGIEKLYTFEHELHRSYLKETLGIDNLSQLPKVWSASQSIVSKIRIFEYTDKNRKLLQQNNRQRIKAMILSPFVQYDRPDKKKYKRSYKAMVRRCRAEIDAYLRSEDGREEDSLAFYTKLQFDLMHDVADGKDIEFSFCDSDRKIEYDSMSAKWEAMKDGQTNELELEAKRRFGKFVSRKNAVAEIEA
jgi:hypothetical protein